MFETGPQNGPPGRWARLCLCLQLRRRMVCDASPMWPPTRYTSSHLASAPRRWKHRGSREQTGAELRLTLMTFRDILQTSDVTRPERIDNGRSLAYSDDREV